MAKGSLLTIKSKSGFLGFILVIHHWEMNPDKEAQQISFKII